MLKNTPAHFGAVAIVLHWLIAVVVIGEFGLGLYMTSVDYYHALYQTMPMVHESVGMLLLLLVLVRSGWGLVNVSPDSGAGVGPWEQRASRAAKSLMNLLLLAIIFCGLLLSFADGEDVSFFYLIDIPAVVTGLPNQEDWSIFWHYWLAWSVIGLASLHTMGALKHHFLDRDETLRRMLGLKDRD